MSKETAMALATGTDIVVPAEGVADPGAKPEAPKPLDSERFASFAKKESEFVKRQEQLKREREEIQAEKEKLRPLAEQYKIYQDLKVRDPIAALKMMGFSEVDIINYLAADEKPELTPEERAAEAATKATEAKIKEFQDAQEKRAKDEQAQKDQKVIEGFKGQLSQIVEADPSKFEYCAYHGQAAQELAYEFTRAVVKESEGKEVITAQEAMEMVEEYYEEQDRLMANLKKRQPKTETKSESDVETPETTRKVTPGFPNAEQPKAAIQKTRTLTNAATASVASVRQRTNETRDQKRERLKNWLASGIKQ